METYLHCKICAPVVVIIFLPILYYWYKVPRTYPSPVLFIVRIVPLLLKQLISTRHGRLVRFVAHREQALPVLLWLEALLYTYVLTIILLINIAMATVNLITIVTNHVAMTIRIFRSLKQLVIQETSHAKTEIMYLSFSNACEQYGLKEKVGRKVVQCTQIKGETTYYTINFIDDIIQVENAKPIIDDHPPSIQVHLHLNLRKVQKEQVCKF